MTGPVQIEGSASELAKEARKKVRSLYSVYFGAKQVSLRMWPKCYKEFGRNCYSFTGRNRGRDI